jgi:hypothetical protein
MRVRHAWIQTLKFSRLIFKKARSQTLNSEGKSSQSQMSSLKLQTLDSVDPTLSKFMVRQNKNGRDSFTLLVRTRNLNMKTWEKRSKRRRMPRK